MSHRGCALPADRRHRSSAANWPRTASYPMGFETPRLRDIAWIEMLASVGTLAGRLLDAAVHGSRSASRSGVPRRPGAGFRSRLTGEARRSDVPQSRPLSRPPREESESLSSVVVSSELLSSVELSELSELELPEPLPVSTSLPEPVSLPEPLPLAEPLPVSLPVAPPRSKLLLPVRPPRSKPLSPEKTPKMPSAWLVVVCELVSFEVSGSSAWAAPARPTPPRVSRPVVAVTAMDFVMRLRILSSTFSWGRRSDVLVMPYKS